MRIRTLLLVTVLAALALPLPTATSRADEGVYVIRFADRITDASRSALESTGMVVLDYEPHDAYLAYGSAEEAVRAGHLPAVSTATPVSIDRKLHPSLAERGGLVRVDVTAYGPAMPRVRAELAPLGRVLGSYDATADGRLAGIGLLVSASSIETIAADPAVLYVQPAGDRLVPEDEATTQIQAGNINASNRPLPGYADWLASKGLDGSGVKVTVVDTGIETYHPDVLGRVTRLQNYASAAEQNDLYGHGTHVAGIVGGNPPTGLLPRDPDGFVLGYGVAPAVEMLDINSVGFTGAFPPSSFEGYTSSSWAWGSRMWNASWTTGGGAGAGYTSRARQMDELTRNAVFATPGMEEFLLVFSAGNSGGSGLTEPKEAKNIISVAASASGRGLRWPLTTNIDTIASFSSRGPAKDGRIAPTLAAPGENVISARAPAAAGLVLGACVPDTFSPLHTPCSGTSMAAPHVTGAAALVHQWWKRETGTAPSPAMVKALLVNGAKDIGSKNIPNRDEGWGRVHLGNVFAEMPDVHEDQGIVFGEPGGETPYIVEVDGTVPFKVTVAWSDAPAAPGANPALVNDLDLVVERLDAEGNVLQTWLGNRFAGGQSALGGTRDTLNNLENVYLNAPEAGTYRVTIRAVNVPGDGIPENADATDQDYALVLRGATPAA